jgi:YegS/Rv2252/BmrU family lipid kinase
MTPQTTLVVVNPASASGKTADRWRGVEAALRDHGVQPIVRITEAAGHATGIVRDFVTGGGRDIVVLGGDGTIGEVVAGTVTDDGSAMLAPDICLGIVHQGTGGDFVRTLGLPRAIPDSTRVAAIGEPMAVDVGVASFAKFGSKNSPVIRAFLNNANVGLGAEVVEKVEGPLKKLGNNLSFGVAAVTSLMKNKPRELSLQIDDGPEVSQKVTDLIVSNGQYMGGGMHVAPGADLDDGLLDVTVIGATGRITLITTFPKIYKGTHVTHPAVTITQGARITVDSPEPQGVVLDGDLVGRTPVSFWMIPRGISVRVEK